MKEFKHYSRGDQGTSQFLISGHKDLHAEIVETTFPFPKYGGIIVVSRLFYFHILMSFLVVPLNNHCFLELTFVSGAD